nr:auxilin-like protein [Tanacetum cinerariifolium]
MDVNERKRMKTDENVRKLAKTKENVRKRTKMCENVRKRMKAHINRRKHPKTDENVRKRTKTEEKVGKQTKMDENVRERKKTCETDETCENGRKHEKKCENVGKLAKTDENVRKLSKTRESDMPCLSQAMFGFLLGTCGSSKRATRLQVPTRYGLGRPFFYVCRLVGISAKKEAHVDFLTGPLDGRSTLRPADDLFFVSVGGKHACVDLTKIYLLVGLSSRSFIVGQTALKVALLAMPNLRNRNIGLPAAPKQTRDLMQVNGLTNDEVKSILQEHGGRGPANGLEETCCSMKLRENIDDATKADLYSLRAKHYTHLNNFKFLVLELLQLGADRGHYVETPVKFIDALIESQRKYLRLAAGETIRSVEKEHQTEFYNQPWYYSMYEIVRKLAHEIQKMAAFIEGVEAKLWQVDWCQD